MGAGASANGAAGAVEGAASAVEGAVAVGTAEIDQQLQELQSKASLASSMESLTNALAQVPEDSKAQAIAMFDKCEGSMSESQISEAAEQVAKELSSLDLPGPSSLACIGSALSSAAQMAPEVTDAVTEALMAIAPHLPLIGIGCALLGGLLVALKQSKENDKNVSTVLLWSASVKDWLLLIAGRIDSSGAESTLPLFEGLKDSLEQMMGQVTKHQKRWRMSKMLSAGTFATEFDRAKNSVLELKNALRDFLDQEMQDAQEAKLQEIASASLDQNAKLDSMESQMAELKTIMLAQNAEKADADKMTDISVEEDLWKTIQSVAGVEGPEVPFKHFALAFESVFLKGGDMPAEEKRGLKIAIDKDGDGKVGKAEWVKLYRKWQESAVVMDDFLLKLADDAPPTMYAQATGHTKVAMEKGAEGLASAKNAAEEAKAKAKEMMGSVSMPKFGFGKKKEKETEADEAAS
jgi:hypothetical protein